MDGQAGAEGRRASPTLASGTAFRTTARARARAGRRAHICTYQVKRKLPMVRMVTGARVAATECQQSRRGAGLGAEASMVNGSLRKSCDTGGQRADGRR